MANTLLIPLDDRPCNSRFPQEMAVLAGFSLITPDTSLLGNAEKPARRDQLQAWLKRHLDKANTLIMSLDTWVYGNLVASRKSPESKAALLPRLLQLSQVKQKHPELKLQIFATLLRISNSNDATEERPYWAQHGRQIYRLSWLEHYLQVHPVNAKYQAEYQHLKKLIPENILTQYRALRQRNFDILLKGLDLVQSGIIETLAIGCDDSGEYGWGVLERQQLQTEITSRNIQERALLYPGADELASVLLARSLVSIIPRIQVRWSFPEAQNQQTRYEGLPLKQTLQSQADACQVKLVHETEQDYDAILWLHNPPGEQIDQFLNRQDRILETKEALKPLLKALSQSEKPILLADLLYANGGDKVLLEQLEQKQLLFRPQVYAAWNTAGNTLGTVLAWFKLLNSGHVRPELQQKFLLERLLDDGWYQGLWRQELSKHYSSPVTLNTCIQLMHKMNERLKSWQQWMPAPPESLQVRHLNFPWRRFFEIELEVCFKNQCDD